MKYIFAFLLLASSQLMAKELVGTSIPPIAFLAERIGGEHVEVITALGAGQNPHAFTLSPKKMHKLTKVTKYLTIKIPFEHKIVRTIRDINSNAVVDISKGIKRISSTDHDHDHDLGHNDNKDPHIWTSLQNLSAMSAMIKDQFIKSFPAHSSSFEKNYLQLQNEIDKKETIIREQLAPLKGKIIMVYHPSINYLTEQFGIEVLPIEYEGKKPTQKQLRKIIEKAKRNGINSILIGDQFDKSNLTPITSALNGVTVSYQVLEKDILNELVKISQKISDCASK